MLVILALEVLKHIMSNQQSVFSLHRTRAPHCNQDSLHTALRQKPFS